MTTAEQTIIDHISTLTPGSTIASDTALLELGLLDSINLVGLIQFVEDRFGVRIPDADIGADLFATPASLAAYVTQRAGAKVAEGA